ncbi:hypothetical protein Sjap_025870 [Stephania japonica]|uniref:Secreted protein n=1 Tax=Stephania japonica TaxID=461633 RepID=A0AAP0E2J7_9MAGN
MALTSEMVLCVFVDGVVAALLYGNGGAEKAKNSSNSRLELHFYSILSRYAEHFRTIRVWIGVLVILHLN